MLAYVFIVEGIGKIAGYAGVADYMQARGADGRLLLLVVLTELGGGLLVLFGFKTRWAAIALFGFCLLTAPFSIRALIRRPSFRKTPQWPEASLLWRFSVLAPGRVARPRHLTKVDTESARPKRRAHRLISVAARPYR